MEKLKQMKNINKQYKLKSLWSSTKRFKYSDDLKIEY